MTLAASTLSAAAVRAAEITKFPRVPFGRGGIGPGRAAWLDRVSHCRFQPGESRAILRGLGRRGLLLVTTAGRDRARAWIAAQRRAPDPVETPRQLRERLRAMIAEVLYGDQEALDAIVSALIRMPRPVRMLTDEITLVVVGHRSGGGWTSGPLPSDRGVVVLAGHHPELPAVVAHELAHVWHRPRRITGAAPVGRLAAFDRVVCENGGGRTIDAAERASEEIAQLCEIAWTVTP